MMAEAYWAEVAAIGGSDPGYARLGRLQPIMDARGLQLAKSRAEGARELWRGKARWEVINGAEIAEDWRPESPTGYVVYDTLSARIHPRNACNALAAALRAKGHNILAEGKALGLEVWATGWEGLKDLSDALGKSAGGGVKGQALLLDLDRRDLPQIFADTVHVVPHADGTVAIGSTSEREFTDGSIVDAQADALLERVQPWLPALQGAAIKARWAGVRPRAKSRAPILGVHPTREGAFIANGGFKIGFGMAPKIGEVMAELILEGRDTIPQDFKPEASL